MHKLYTLLWLELDASFILPSPSTIHHRYRHCPSHSDSGIFTHHPSHFLFSLSVNQYNVWWMDHLATQAKPKSSPKRVKFKIGCKLPEAVSAANEIQYNPIGLALLFSFFGIRFPDCSLFDILYSSYSHLLPCILLTLNRTITLFLFYFFSNMTMIMLTLYCVKMIHWLRVRQHRAGLACLVRVNGGVSCASHSSWPSQ